MAHIIYGEPPRRANGELIEPFRRTFPIATSVQIGVEYKADHSLSISGVIAPTRDGNADSAGQIYDTLRERIAADRKALHDWEWARLDGARRPRQRVKFADGWDAARVNELLVIWEQWHLNTMHAGTKAQREFINSLGSSPNYALCVNQLAAAGILHDPAVWRLTNQVDTTSPAYVRVDQQPADVQEAVAQWHTQWLESLTGDFAAYSKAHADAAPAPIQHLVQNYAPYRYGSAWLGEYVPANLLEWLERIENNIDILPPVWIPKWVRIVRAKFFTS